jgi:hypothetical protein
LGGPTKSQFFISNLVVVEPLAQLHYYQWWYLCNEGSYDIGYSRY